MMLDAHRLVEEIRHKLDECGGRPLVAFWYQVRTDRDRYAAEVRAAANGLPVVPLVLRGGFDNPHAVMADLNRLIVENRTAFHDASLPQPPWSVPLTLLLVARGSFGLGQISSPAVLPEWFPVLPGQTALVSIEDMFWTAKAALRVPELRADDLSEKLYALDLALTARLTRAYERDRNRGMGFFDAIRLEPKKGPVQPAEKFPDFLKEASEFLKGDVKEPTGYRPSARDAKSPVGRLMRLASKSSPDELTRRATVLSQALDLPVDQTLPEDALVTVLVRSTNPVLDLSVPFARNLIVTVFAASQLVTAAAHSDGYPHYPIVLLQSLSFNLRQTLDELTRCLEEWPTSAGVDTGTP